MLKFISNEPNENDSPNEAVDVFDDNIQKKNRTVIKNHPSIIFRERGRIFQLTIGKNNLITLG